MKDFFEWVFTELETIYYIIAGLTVDIRKELAGKVKVFAFITFLALALLVVGIIWSSKELAMIMALVSAIIFLVAWNGIRLSSVTTKKLGEFLGIGDGGAAKELKRLFFPLCTISVMMAFTAVYIAVNGTSLFRSPSFPVIFTGVSFFAIFIVYTQSEKKWAGYIMAGLVTLMLLGHAWPPAQRLVYSSKMYVDSVFNRISINKQADGTATYAMVIEEGVFYGMDEITPNLNKVAKLSQRVLVRNIDKDLSTSGSDPMVTVSLSNAFNDFTDDTTYKFPRRKLGEFKVVSDLNAPPPPGPSGKTLKTVLTQEVTGKGYGESDKKIEAPYIGKDIKYGDKVIITGKEFEFNNDGWHKYHEKFEDICRNSGQGMLSLKAPEGEKVKIEIQRMM